MTDFYKKVTQIEQIQKISYLLAAIIIPLLTLLWIVDIQFKSDRPSLAVSRDRPGIKPN
ncbi:hypothetical protein H6G64_34145 [Calothrix sp. FACHB-156]|nr:hypothetical protein [Calothrix sp. FACHB-156]